MHNNCCLDLQVTLLGVEPDHTNHTRLFHQRKKETTGGGNNLSSRESIQHRQNLTLAIFVQRQGRTLPSLPGYNKWFNLSCPC